MRYKGRGGKAPAPPSKSGDWLTTYSDMVTLLFAFFVLLFAISTVDANKFNMLAASLSKDGFTTEQLMQIGGLTEHEKPDSADIDPENPKVAAPGDLIGEGVGVQNSFEDVYNSLVEYFSEKDVGEEAVTLSYGADYVFIRFSEGVLFEPNSARIRTADYEILSFIGEGLKHIEQDIDFVRIDGHTASVPDYEDYPVSDRLLSSDRANSVLMYFEDTVQLAPEKLMACSFGKYKPIADNTTPEGRQKNRRIEILVTSSNIIEMHLEDIYREMEQEP